MSRSKRTTQESTSGTATAGRITFERLLADVAARCANAPSEHVVAEIEHGLNRLVEVLGYDRCSYSELSADGTLQVVCSAATTVAALPRGPLHPELNWLTGELRAGRVVALDKLPDDLPAGAAAERARCRETGMRSHLSVPLMIDGHVTGALSFAAFRRQRAWRGDVVRRLSIIGEVFMSRMARARSEAEARELRSRLWHADRVARVSALTAAIAHEINQPLAAILSNAQAGLADLSRGEVRAEALRQILEAVVRDDKRAADTIRAMRAFLRYDDSGRARIDLAEALREVLQLLSAELSRKGIRVEKRIEPGCWVSADKTQIEQVVLNLVLNATAAMENSAPAERRLTVAAARTAGGRVAIEVRDTGTGIEVERLATMFEPFRTTRKDGLGLGLAICRSIVEAHGGSIGVERNADRGITVRFDLLAAAADPMTTIAVSRSAAPALQPAAARSGPLVCVVDDEDAVRESLARLLGEHGFAVATYASAEDFLSAAPLEEIGCALFDLHMPGMSGIELQERLAATRLAPPLVFVTGDGELAAGVAAMKRGAVDFLRKPVDNTLLLAAVRTAVARHASQRTVALRRTTLESRLTRLSVREREVMEQVIQGRLNKQIAADLDIALQTVKQHRARVMDKMEARSLADLVRECEASGLVLSRQA